jgi:hypothetical protein
VDIKEDAERQAVFGEGEMKNSVIRFVSSEGEVIYDLRNRKVIVSARGKVREYRLGDSVDIGDITNLLVKAGFTADS